LGIEEFDSNRRQDPILKNMVHRVKFAVDPGLDRVFPRRFQTRVRIRLKNGKRWEKECGLPWGPDDPPTDREMAEKFFYLANGVLHPSKIDEWLALFSRGIEEDKRLQNFFQLLATRV
jgi:2-methylcitrate dehydratase PrpD